MIYEVDDVTRRYDSGRSRPGVLALDRVSFTVTERQRLGIVGESGSGKTTLIRLMAALDRSTSGQIRFEGEPVTTDLARLRSSVQLVFQDPRSSLNPRMRVGDIITEPLRSRIVRRGVDVPDDPAARMAEVIDAVGLPSDSARRYPHEFSGGQRQRIAIARALAPRPRVLIADEPVSALDVSVRAQVLNLLDDLVDSYGLTLIMVSHDLAVVRHVCDSVIVLHDGRIAEQGTTQQVYDHPSDPYTRALIDAIPSLSKAIADNGAEDGRMDPRESPAAGEHPSRR